MWEEKRVRDEKSAAYDEARELDYGRQDAPKPEKIQALKDNTSVNSFERRYIAHIMRIMVACAPVSLTLPEVFVVMSRWIEEAATDEDQTRLGLEWDDHGNQLCMCARAAMQWVEEADDL
jgi:hypothetical protein